jgi:hypothetical protein
MNMNGKREDAIGRVKPSPLFSNSSGSSRIFLHAIDDTYKSKCKLILAGVNYIIHVSYCNRQGS